jgi:ribosome assembly protein YihI (activator of Der GTPase)
MPVINAQMYIARSDELNKDKIRSLLAQLQKELDNGATLDNETIALLKKLDRNVETMDKSGGSDNAPVMDDAIALEARFAADHPVAERVLRELIDTLGKMGI